MTWQRRQTLQALSLLVTATLLPRQARPLTPPPPPTPPKEKVAGIGGLFFRAHNPSTLAQWYEQHLGINPIPTAYTDQPWQQESGPTAFAPFSETTKYFPAEKTFMINFRVHDLDTIAKQLTDAGIPVKIDPQTYPNGRFARLQDPEGNPIELWQPSPATKP